MYFLSSWKIIELININETTIKSMKEVKDVDVELTFDPPWQAPEKIKKMFKI